MNNKSSKIIRNAPLWKKSTTGTLPSEALMEFLSGQDVILDRALMQYDIQASQAHINGLLTIGVLSQIEYQQLHQALSQLLIDFENGEFVLDQRFEDSHSAIEWYLSEVLGELSGKVHTGRSRNDQVMVAIRLYMRDRLEILAHNCHAIALSCLHKATEFEFLPLPGYTHLQRAMPSSVGLWMAGFAEAFIDNLELTLSTLNWINASPLGTASGFGINLPLPRDQVAQELGFERLQINPQNVQNSRGKYELQVLQAMSMCTLDLRRLAWDLSLYTSQEFDFVHLPEEYTTGSSIMPNKKNPDSVELLRAVHASVQAASTELQGILSLPSSYHRDLQFTKAPLMRALETGLQALGLLPELIKSMQFNSEKMQQAISSEMYATDQAVDAVKQGRAFRDVYQDIMQESDAMQSADITNTLAHRNSPGANGNLMLEEMRQRLASLMEQLK
ncbi:MAG: argininosuccinate lyase [Gammaproteobacteria bacterium]|nr:argininosuccinate lyase [Gammaproteobacteria bacterium]NNM13158.1 argininosuccinate lyase [Gammaproteobacteria bacterium]